MINTYYIKIVADDQYQRVECGGSTPALLEDAIKAVVKEFYKKGQPLPWDSIIFQKGVAEGRRLEREDALAVLERLRVDVEKRDLSIAAQCGYHIALDAVELLIKEGQR